MRDEEEQSLTPEELAEQEAQELPAREQMSALEPPLPLRPMPIDFGDGDYIPPESA